MSIARTRHWCVLTAAAGAERPPRHMPVAGSRIEADRVTGHLGPLTVHGL
ncbi:MAG: hypothetical protein H0U94_00165 [Acidobacteria bacterium]|nr:hypothetical protein [Acidobacteriota bacterium]